MSYIYIASPYTDDDPDVREGRYRAVCLFTSQALSKKPGYRAVFSPIVHCHELAKISNLPHEMLFWRDYNCAMLQQARQLKVLQLPGWETSVGVHFEWGYAKGMGIEVTFIYAEPSILAELHSGKNT